MHIRRKWVDCEGTVWYVLRGPLVQVGYPKGGRSVAFEEALQRVASRRPAEPVLMPTPQTSSPTAARLTDEALSRLLYRARTGLARPSS